MGKGRRKKRDTPQSLLFFFSPPSPFVLATQATCRTDHSVVFFRTASERPQKFAQNLRVVCVMISQRYGCVTGGPKELRKN